MALWFALPLVALRELDVMPAMKLSLAACLQNMQPFLVWSLPPLAVTIVLAVPFTAAIAARSLVLGLVSTPLLVLDFVLLLALTFASIYTSYRDVFALGD
jgi:membrane-anchored glycerophosphoryl diester phosphodiesterase (GDPDase)